AGGGTQTEAAIQQRAALQMYRQILVPQLEPGLGAQFFQCFKGVPALPFPAPALGFVADPAKGVHHRVQIGADGQAEMVEIVAGVDHDRELPGGKYPTQTQSQLGTAHTAAQGDHFLVGVNHRNRSSLPARSRAVAGRSASITSSPRNTALRPPSLASPISRQAAAAISSPMAGMVTCRVRP